MQSSVIGKIEKARRYAEEKDRVSFSSLTAKFKGDHGDHIISYQDGKWTCSCSFFLEHEMCSHSMALQKILVGMVVDQ